MRKTLTALLSILLIGTIGIGCRNKLALDANGVPNTLVVAIYEGDNPGDVEKALVLIRPYLEKKLNMKVEFQKSTDYTSVIEAIDSKKVHMAYLSPFSYILATRKDPLVPLVVLSQNGSPVLYRSLIVTSPKTGLNNMDDVKARAKDLTLCFADPASTSGHLVPRAYLTSIGLNPDNAFKETMFAGSHAASAMTVKAGKVDIGCIYQFALEMMIRKNMIKPDDLKILWTSDPIVEGPVTMRTDINPDFAQKVRQAYYDMPKEAPLAWTTYVSIYRNNTAGMAYVAAADSMYDNVRRISAGVRNLDFKK